jgi:hypothetical protein
MRYRSIFLISFLLFAMCTPVRRKDSLPGIAITHYPASSGIYVGCPGIAMIGEGVYLAKHSEFGPGSSEWESAITHVFRSDDAGQTWYHVSMVNGLFWASIFAHKDAVYLFGTDKHHGNTVIMRSDDQGTTWTVPNDENSGLLLEGQFHTAPVPVLIHSGRIWRAMEDATGTKTGSEGPWGGPQYGSFMMSASVDADLLHRDNWTISNVIDRDQEWLGGHTRAWLEGNAVMTPQGEVATILRLNFLQDAPVTGGMAAFVHVNDDGKRITFDPEKDFIDFPGGAKKFTIRYDPESNRYWSLTNFVPSHHQGLKNAANIRNTLALVSSNNLIDWQVNSIVLYHPDIDKHAFQYVDWLFEGEDIIAVSRTAYDDGMGGAKNAHDANYLSFHRIENFRALDDDDLYESIIELSRNHPSWHIPKPEPREVSEHMTARWCFEMGDSPLDDTGVSGVESNRLESKGSVMMKDGIAMMDAGTPGLALIASPGTDLDANPELTVWMRMKACQQPGDTLWLLTKGAAEHKDLSYRIFLTSKEDVEYQLSAGMILSMDGANRVQCFPSDTVDHPPVGLWIQLAMVAEVYGPLVRTRLYYRTEHTSRPNPWVLLEQGSAMHSVFKSDAPLIIGNDHNYGSLSAGIWLDEVKLFNRALTIEELFECRAIYSEYPDVPETVPGVVVDYSHASTSVYLGSPSIAILPDGSYVAKSDEYGRGAKGAVTRVYQSSDQGQSWKQISKVDGMFWANLFVHNGELYMMGTGYGHGGGICVIRKSTDGGFAWTVPEDKHTGILFDDPPYHTAPMPMVIHGGRIWRSMEDEKGILPQHWGTRFRAFMMSAPLDSDLLKASSWTASDKLGYNPKWLDGRFRGWCEGNAVLDPHDNIVNVLRVDHRPDGGKAAIIRYSSDGKRSYFDPGKDFIDFPGGNKKFYIRYDEQSGHYWAMSNPIIPKHAGGNLDHAREYVRKNIPTSSNPGGRFAFSNPERTRNTLVLMTSTNLREWKIRKVVLYHPEIGKHGFQYPYFLFDDQDIIFLSRTAYDDGKGGADNQHNANYLTFHRISNFRDLVVESEQPN